MPSSNAAHTEERTSHGLAARAWWPATRRLLSVAFLLLVLVLLFRLARNVDWHAGWAALRSLPTATLGAAAALAAASHALYCSYDLLGRHQTGHGVPRHAVAAVGFISYAFNLNLGSLVGGVALRYRLYAALGLGPGVVTRVLALSLVTNWLGYAFLASLVLLLQPPPLPAVWGLPSLGWLGAALGGVVLFYLLLCARAGGRERSWRGRKISLPRGRMALLQLLLSSLNWSLIAGVLYVLLQHKLTYVDVLGTLLLAAVAGAVAHVPAGLGVLEAVFLSVLSAQLPQGELLGALLAYRALYYLLPLGLAVALYLATRRGPLAARSDKRHGAGTRVAGHEDPSSTLIGAKR